MSFLEITAANLVSPAILCFALGAFSVFLRSDLRLPESVFSALSITLMLAIGLKGGAELAGRSLPDLALPMAAGLALGCAIPLWSYAVLRRWLGLSAPDAAALAAHYGSVSAVTFAAATALLDAQGIAYEGYVAALLAIMEAPAIVVSLAMAAFATAPLALRASGAAAVMTGRDTRGLIGAALSDALSSKSVLLLAGGLAIGALAGPAGLSKVKPFFVDLFPGLLCLFLLELGRLAASRIGEFRQVGAKLALFAIAAPVLHGALGVALAHAIGLSQGGAIIMGTLAASASYIAAPAAVRLALPEANPAYYLTCSLAITFPFNIVIGLPLYAAMASALHG